MDSFAKFPMGQVEFNSGLCFTPLQKMSMQNVLAEDAEEALLLTFKLEDSKEENRIRAAYLKGKIDGVKYLMAYEDTLNAMNPDVKLPVNSNGDIS